MNRFSLLLIAVFVAYGRLGAETCITQSALSPVERSTLADTARSLALAVQANDVPTLRSFASGDLQKNFGALQYLVAVTSPKLAGGVPQVEQLYVLDATNLKPNPDGSLPEAQFFCNLNKSPNEAQFAIAGLAPGRYSFAVVTVAARPAPWHLSMLLKQDSSGQQARWLLAGIYPKPLTIAGHDGLWYWTEARQYSQHKQSWNAWLYYQAAEALLRPADFVLSTHLDKLHTEAVAAAPPALSEGISPANPLVLKSPSAMGTTAATPRQPPQAGAVTGPASTDLRFTALALGDPPVGASTPVLVVRFQTEPVADPASARSRNTAAAHALLSAYPELRTPFQSITVTGESTGHPPLATDIAIADIR